MKTSPNRLFATLVLALTLCALPGQAAVLLEYDFNANSVTQPSSGSITTAVTIGGAGSVGAASSGVSGLAGDRAFVTGNSGMGASQTTFNGIASGSVDLPSLSAFTITGWFNASTVLSSSAALFRTTDGQIVLKANQLTSGTIDLTVNGVISNRSTTTNTMFSSINSWVFFSVTWDGSSVSYYQANKTTAVAQLGSSVALSTTMGNPAAGLDIGNFATSLSNTARPFAGMLDNMSLYDSVLTTGQLETIRQNDIANVPEPSVALLFGLGLVAVSWRVRARVR